MRGDKNTTNSNNHHSTEQIKESLEAYRKGGVKNSIGNCVKVLKNDPKLRGAIAKNLLTERVDIVNPLWWERTGSTITDTDMNYLLLYLEENYGLTNENKALKAIDIVANENCYHPIRDYIDQLQWDGKERIRYALHRFLGSEESEYNYQALKLFMLGAIHRAFHPGCKFETMLCLVGGQGAGKSTFFRFMAIRDEWFSDDLRNLDDENVYRKLQGHWIIEMSEMMATANAKSIEGIKSFLSRQKETYKVPYETHPADRLRQCVFAGTTNRQDFLPRDRTGNRRFIPVNVYPERAEVHILADEESSRAYIDQLWAEAMVIYCSGDYKLSFTAEMENSLRTQQQDFMQEDPQAGMIYAFLDDFTGDRVCSKLLYAEALDHKFTQPQSWETREICEIMNTGIANGTIKGWVAYKNPKRYAKYGSQKGWERIKEQPLVDNSITPDDDLPFD
ncbi:MAG: virulence-associated protein E [Ruminococcus sp.]|nr:virulence-associated protein E [Ruminococcus sp.]